MPSEMWDLVHYPFPNSNAFTVEVWNEWVISYHTITIWGAFSIILKKSTLLFISFCARHKSCIHSTIKGKVYINVSLLPLLLMVITLKHANISSIHNLPIYLYLDIQISCGQMTTARAIGMTKHINTVSNSPRFDDESTL